MKEETEFKLPKNWHVVVTKENQHVLSGWRGTSEGYLVPVNNIVGMTMGDKGHNGRNEIKDTSVPCVYDFGQEITFKQFKKYVLKEEIKTFSKEEMIEFGEFVKDISASWHSFNPIKKVVETVLFSDYLKMKERLKKEAERNKDTLIELEKEQGELSEKILKMTAFSEGNDFDNIDEMLISVQLQAMNTHNECLIQRIYNAKQKQTAWF